VADTHESMRAVDTDSRASVIRLLYRVGAGDEVAVSLLLDHFFAQLKRYVLKKLTGIDREAIDESAFALDAYRSFVSWVAAAPDPELDNEEDIWKVLSTIALRKSLKVIAKQNRRAAQFKSVSESTLEGPDRDRGGLDNVAGHNPRPLDDASISEIMKLWIDSLDERQRMIIELSRQGMSDTSIADELGISEKRVRQQLRKSKTALMALLKEDEQ
jgi:RNA polymerase sigma factor (sigma-70 family)